MSSEGGNALESSVNILDRNAAREAWEKFRSKGTATRQAARLLHVGLGEYLDLFSRKHLGENGFGEACKLVLGTNGEGKTHLLYCIRETALREGHLVAMVEAKNVGAAMSPFIFAQEVMKRLETPSVLNSSLEDENPLIRLLRESIDMKKAEITAAGLDPEDLVPEWAEGMRTKNLLPLELATCLADGLLAADRRNVDGMLEAIKGMTFENVKLSKDREQVAGVNLLKSIVKLPRLLGFRSLVLLIDEAELAIEKAGSAKRRAFFTFMRFVNDHMASGDGDSAVVMIACTDDFWPSQFAEYSALKGRLLDPGYDTVETRTHLSTKALVNKNKLWVRETFRGREADFVALGEGLLQIGSQVLTEVDFATQMDNAGLLARIASSPVVTPWIKRPFVKAFAMTVQDQVDNGEQFVLSETEGAARFDLARDEIMRDEEE
jgi:ABC-type iron transport system FetAB ATPase subunit